MAGYPSKAVIQKLHMIDTCHNDHSRPKAYLALKHLSHKATKQGSVESFRLWWIASDESTVLMGNELDESANEVNVS